MVSIIITSYKEPKTIANAIRSAAVPEYSGLREEFELITVIPDRATNTAAVSAVKKLGIENYTNIIDPQLGKPHALNMAFRQAKGDILVLSDGDVYLAKNSVQAMVTQLRKYPQLGGVTGRQISIDKKDTMFGYYSHLFSDALHKIRSKSANGNPNNRFFPMSGYVMAVKKELVDFELPDDILVDDGYISHKIYNKGYRIGYTDSASAYVRYPKNSNDYYLQKLRTNAGFLQLKKLGLVKPETDVRSPMQDLRMFFFPLLYARSLRELFWSSMLYILRLDLWIRLFLLRIFMPSKLASSWKRIESTK